MRPIAGSSISTPPTAPSPCHPKRGLGQQGHVFQWRDMLAVLRSLRIGYVPYTRDLCYAGDRRRFCYYAHKRNIAFELAKPSESYDIVVVTERGDLGTWSAYQRGNAKIVYSLINRYLAVPAWDPKGVLRGVAKYVTRETRHLQLNYWRAMEAMCERADAVVCTTEEQRQDILPHCDNVHIILDIPTADVRRVVNGY